jgi:hypothetical protein
VKGLRNLLGKNKHQSLQWKPGRGDCPQSPI